MLFLFGTLEGLYLLLLVPVTFTKAFTTLEFKGTTAVPPV